MTNKEESRFGMFKDVDGHLIENLPHLKDLPDLVKNAEALHKNNEEIDRIVKVQNFDKTGLAQEKKQLRDVVVLIANDNSKKLEAFAKLGNKTVLAKETKFTKSKMTASSDIIVYEYAQMIFDKAQENIDSLGAFGITAETQTVFQSTIDAYKASVSKPRLGLKEKKEATKDLKRLFNESEEILSRIDAVMYIINGKQPGIYNRYRDLRKVVITGTGSLAMRAAAIEIPSGIPLKGVKFAFTPIKTTMGLTGTGEVIKKTADKGTFYLKSLAEGTYRVKVSKTGYKEKEINVTVVSGELLDVAVELEKA
jgi:hypothetical protein